jgi:hypothetical protein
MPTHLGNFFGRFANTHGVYADVKHTDEYSASPLYKAPDPPAQSQSVQNQTREEKDQKSFSDMVLDLPEEVNDDSSYRSYISDTILNPYGVEAMNEIFSGSVDTKNGVYADKKHTTNNPKETEESDDNFSYVLVETPEQSDDDFSYILVETEETEETEEIDDDSSVSSVFSAGSARSVDYQNFYPNPYTKHDDLKPPQTDEREEENRGLIQLDPDLLDFIHRMMVSHRKDGGYEVDNLQIFRSLMELNALPDFSGKVFRIRRETGYDFPLRVILLKYGYSTRRNLSIFERTAYVVTSDADVYNRSRIFYNDEKNPVLKKQFHNEVIKLIHDLSLSPRLFGGYEFATFEIFFKYMDYVGLLVDGQMYRIRCRCAHVDIYLHYKNLCSSLYNVDIVERPWYKYTTYQIIPGKSS